MILLCADHPFRCMPPRPAGFISTAACGMRRKDFLFSPYVYYRPAVDNLELSMKPHRYELDLRATEQDAALRDYLRQADSR